MAIDSSNENFGESANCGSSKTRTVSFSDTKNQQSTSNQDPNIMRAARFQFTPEEGHGRFVAKNLSQVFDSIDSRRGESDRKVPRQARPIISRKDVEKGPRNVPPPVVPVVPVDSAEFRTRAQTAPVNSLKRRKDRERASANVIDNNNDESLDEGNGPVANVESHPKNEKNKSKYRFAFKKNLAKENGQKEEASLGKAINRRLKGKEGNVTPNREILAQSAPVDAPGDIQNVRTRSASASSNSERRRRTRRRRGRKSGTVDNEISDLSFEDALQFVHQDQMENQEMFYTREGTTWEENGCEMQVVGGTTYFTPIPATNPDRSDVKDDKASPLENPQKFNAGWSPENGETYQEGPMFSMKVESYEEFHPKGNRKPIGITQSAPMGGRMVKQEPSRHVGIEDLRENLKFIWSETEKKLKPEEEVKLTRSEKLAAETGQLAEETALAAIIDNKVGSKSRNKEGSQSVDRDQISKIWENDRKIGENSTTLPIKTNSIWEPTDMESLSRSRDNSPTQSCWSDGLVLKDSYVDTSKTYQDAMSELRLFDPKSSPFDPSLSYIHPVSTHQLNHHHLNGGSSSDSRDSRGIFWTPEISMAHAK